MTRLLRFINMLGPPLLAFVAARVFILAIAAFYGFPPWDPNILARWDSFHYLSIATRGYYRVWQVDPFFPGTPKIWIGNFVWMPGYSLIIRFVLWFGFTPAAAGALVSAVFELLTLLLLWIVFFRSRWSLSNALCLGIAAFFPGMIYYHAVYPLSLLNFLTLLCILFASQQKWIQTGIFSFLATLTYATGLVVGAALAIWTVLGNRSRPMRQRLGNAAIVSAFTLLGVGAVMLMQRLAMGVWLQFFRGEQHFSNARTFPHPLHTFLQIIAPIGGSRSFQSKTPAIQSLFVAILIVGLIGDTLLRRTKGTPKFNGIIVTFLASAWLFPLMIGHTTSMFRVESSLVPAVILMPRLSAPLLFCIFAICLYLAYWMCALYFLGALI